MKRTIPLILLSALITIGGIAQEKEGLFKTKFSDKDPWADQFGYLGMVGVTTGKDFGTGGEEYKNFGAGVMITSHLSMLSVLFKDKPFIISDYETVGIGMGLAKVDYRDTWGHMPLWVGFDLGIGAAALVRLNKHIDIGTRFFYGALANSARSNSQDQGWFLRPNIRFNTIYIEYTRTVIPKRANTNAAEKYPVNMCQIKYINPETGRQIGIRTEFGSLEGSSFSNGQYITMKRNSFCVQFCFVNQLWK